MAIWMGETGGIRLERLASAEPFYAISARQMLTLAASGFRVDRVTRSLITGDLVWIKRVDDRGQPVV